MMQEARDSLAASPPPVYTKPSADSPKVVGLTMKEKMDRLRKLGHSESDIAFVANDGQNPEPPKKSNAASISGVIHEGEGEEYAALRLQSRGKIDQMRAQMKDLGFKPVGHSCCCCYGSAYIYGFLRPVFLCCGEVVHRLLRVSMPVLEIGLRACVRTGMPVLKSRQTRSLCATSPQQTK
jgi:hypothetical protein